MYQDWMELVPVIGAIKKHCDYCNYIIEINQIYCSHCGKKQIKYKEYMYQDWMENVSLEVECPYCGRSK